MSTPEALGHIGDLLTARRVYADPIERDGIVVIPAAQIGGGGGSERIDGQKDGGGMGLSGRPIGAFEIRDGKTTWKAAIDWNRVILRAQLIGLAIFVCGALRVFAYVARTPFRIENDNVRSSALRYQEQARSALAW